MPVTQVLSIDDPSAISTAKKLIKAGNLIAIPTDTIYGVAGDPFSPAAIRKIYEVKERPQEKALPVLIGDLHQLADLVQSVSFQVRRIAESFWPGALTLVLPKSQRIPPELSPHPTIGIRMPDLDFTLKLLAEIGPLAVTSANISNGPNSTTADEVAAQLGGRIDLILNGGATPGPTASTVLDASGPELYILREGPISLSEINALLGKD
jgi:L-threonylcarbamoyladenylate synthase